MSGITGLSLTHAGLGPPGYVRAVSTASGSEGGAQLWVTKHPGQNGTVEPIVEVAVVHDDASAAPSGFEVAPLDAMQGVDAPAFIAFRRRGMTEEAAPVTAIAIDTDASPAPPGYTVVEPPLTRGEKRISLAFRLRQEGDEPDWFGETVVAGMKIDAQNLARDWLKAEVVEVHRHDAVVHFLGWEKVYDRFLPLRSDLMAEYDTKTEGIDTRGSLDGDEDFEVSAAALAPYMLKIDGILSGAATRAEADMFMKRDLSEAVAQVLSSFVAPELFDDVSSFVHSVVRLCCFYLATTPAEEKLPPSVIQQLARVFLSDERCNTFFTDKSHALRGDVPEAAEYRGFAARLPPGGASTLFVTNVNVLYGYGGFELMIRRIDDEVDPIGMDEVGTFLGFLGIAWRNYTPEFVRDVWPRIVRASLNRVLRMNEAELRVYKKEKLLSPDELVTAVKLIEAALTKAPKTRHYPDAHVSCLEPAMDAQLERTWAGLAARQLRVPSLPIRVEAVDALRALVRLIPEEAGAPDFFAGDDDAAGARGGGYGSSYGSSYGGGYGSSYSSGYGTRGYNRGYNRQNAYDLAPLEAVFFTGPTLARFLNEANVVQAVLGQVDENQDHDLAALIEPATEPGSAVPLALLAPRAGTEWADLAMQGILPFDEAQEGRCRDRVTTLREAAAAVGAPAHAEPQPGVAAGGAAAAGAAAGGAASASASHAAPAAAALAAPESGSRRGRRTTKRASRLGPHEKLVPKLSGLMLFMAHHGELERSHLDALWAANPGATDESLRRAIFEAIGKLSSHLDPEMLAALYALITETPLAQLDDTTLDLVKSLSAAVLAAQPEAAAAAASTAEERKAEAARLEATVAGIGLFWRVIEAPPSAGVAPDLVSMAMSHLVDVVSEEGAPARLLLSHNIARSISFIAEGRAAAKAAELAAMLLACVPAHAALASAAAAVDPNAPAAASDDEAGGPPSEPWTRSSVIASLQRDSDVLGLLLRSLADFHRAAEASMAAAGIPPAFDDVTDASRAKDATVKSGTELYAEGVQQRLSFLAYLLMQSSETRITEEQLGALWGLFVERALTRLDRATFFTWLKGAQFNRGFDGGLVDDAGLERLLVGRFCSDAAMRFRAAREADLACVLRVVNEVNLRDGVLSGVPSSVTSLRTKSLELKGIEALWGIITQAEHADTWRAAADSLVQYYTQLFPESGPTLEEASNTFLHDIMERVRLPVKTLESGDSSANLALRRVLETLRAFITALDETGRVVRSVDSMLVPVEVHDPNDPLLSRGRVVRRLYLTVDRQSTTVHAMREHIAAAIGHVASRLRVENHLHQYYDGKRSEYWLASRLVPGSGVHALPLASEDKTTLPHKDRPDQHPAMSAADDEGARARILPMARLTHDDELFNALLSVVRAGDDDTADVAWDLISSVPTNVDVKRAVRSLAGAVEPTVAIPGEFLSDAEELGVLGRTSGSSADGGADDGAARAASIAKAVDWDQVLPDDSPETLLYSLGLVRRILDAPRGNSAAPDLLPNPVIGGALASGDASRHECHHVGLIPAELEAEEAREAARALWLDTFLQTGGLGRILEVLTSSDRAGGSAMSSRLGRKAMESVVHLAVFLTTRVDSSRRELGVRPLVPEMRVEDYPAWVRGRLAEANADAAAGDLRSAAIARTLRATLKRLDAGAAADAAAIDDEDDEVEAAEKRRLAEEESLAAAAAEMADMTFELHGTEVDEAAMVTRLLRLVQEAADCADAEKLRRDAAKALKEEDEEEEEEADGISNIMNPSKNASKKKDDPEDPKLHGSEDVSVESGIAVGALELLVRICIARPQALAVLYADPGAVRSLLRPLLAAGEMVIRDRAADRLLLLARVFLGDPSRLPAGVPQPRDWLLSSFLGRVGEGYLFPRTSSQFYTLLAALVTLVAPGATAPPPLPVDGRSLAEDLAAAVKAHPVVEAAPDDSDIVLRGTLRVVRALGTASPEMNLLLGSSVSDGGLGLVDEVYEQCLFFKPPADAPPDVVLPPKCRSLRSRRAAFAALLGLASGSTANARALMHRIFASSSEADADEDEDEDAGAGAGAKGSAASAAARRSGVFLFPASAGRGALAKTSRTGGARRRRFEMLYDVKSSTGYAGLVNMGCICYMNASNQQLFMIPALRKGVLEHALSATSAAAGEDSVTLQFQRMLANLQETQRRAFNPRSLCMALKDWDGNPTDVMEQRDASEYLTQVFDKLETEMAGSPQAGLLKSVVGGRTATEFIAEGGRRYRTRPSPFYFLSTTVRHCKTLEESLRKDFGAGDMMEKYRWEDDEEREIGRFDTVRRSSLETAPSHLIVHFKRLDIDLTRGIPVKLNSRFEFPRRLSLWPYTLQGRADAVKGRDASTRRVVDPEDPSTHVEPGSADDVNPLATDAGPEDFEYELVGMVIHIGSATRGHYYSYTQERGADGPTGRWFEFNDTFVAPWDPARIEEDCFGGEETYQGRGYYDYKLVGGKYVKNWVEGKPYKRVRMKNAFLAFYDKVKPSGAGGASPAAPAAASAASSPVCSSSPGGTGTPLSRASSRPDLEEEAAAAVAARVSSTGSARALAEAYADTVKAAQATKRSAQTATRVAVPDALLREIKGADLAIWKKRTTESPDYFKFIRRLLSELSAERGAAGAAAEEASAAPASKLAAQIVDAAEELEREEEDENAEVDDAYVDPDDDTAKLRRGPVRMVVRPETLPLPEPEVPYPAGGVASADDAVAKGGSDVSVAQLAIRFTAMSMVSSDATVARDAAKWAGQLVPVLRRNVVVCVWLINALASSSSNLRAALIGHEDAKLREVFVALVRIAVRSVLRYESVGLDSDAGELTALPGLGDDGAATEDPGLDAESAATDAMQRNRRAPADDDVSETFDIAPGQSVRRLTEALLAELPALGSAALTWAPVFEVLQDVLDFGGRPAAVLMTARCTVSALCELIAPGTPMETVVEVVGDFCPSDLHARFQRSRGAYNYARTTKAEVPLTAEELRTVRLKPVRVYPGANADTTPALAVLATLARWCLPPSGSDGSPHGLAGDGGPIPLPRSESVTITSSVFLTRLFSCVGSGAERDALRPFFRHLVWGTSGAFVDRLAATVRSIPAMRDVDGQTIMQPLFAIEAALPAGDGDADAPRTHAVMDAFVEGLEGQSTKHFFVTERGIRCLCKVASRNEAVMAWAAANPARVRWMPDWLVRYPNNKRHGTLRLSKSGLAGDAINAYVWRPPDTLANARRLATGVRPVFVDRGYDDDDPQSLVGKRVRINLDSDGDTRFLWLRSRVVGFIKARSYHRLAHDWDAVKSNRIRAEAFRVWVIDPDAPLLEGEDSVPPGEVGSGLVGDNVHGAQEGLEAVPWTEAALPPLPGAPPRAADDAADLDGGADTPATDPDPVDEVDYGSGNNDDLDDDDA